jgi:hypothetical protein
LRFHDAVKEAVHQMWPGEVGRPAHLAPNIFLGFSVLAPPNPTAVIALLLSAFAVSGAMFLILELDQPFGGVIRISSKPMTNALNQFLK